MDEITLECGCVVALTKEWEYGCAGDCHPGSYVTSGGRIVTACETHNGLEDE